LVSALRSSTNHHKQVNLALQGGGAHGAFTWGVLDRLLEDSFLSIDTLSGTSAGAVNAVAFASGYAQDGVEGARRVLRAVWQDIAQTGDAFQGGSLAPNMIAKAFLGHVSPYALNPFTYDPLRDVLETHIDFEALHHGSSLAVYIAATKASTGGAHLFSGPEITLEAVLASCCLPFVSKAVVIEGEAYWDGAFSANPALHPVVVQSNTDDTLIIQLSDLTPDVLPTNMAGIRSHVSRLSCHQSLRTEFTLMTQNADMTQHRFHLIDGSAVTNALAVGSELTPSQIKASLEINA